MVGLMYDAGPGRGSNVFRQSGASALLTPYRTKIRARAAGPALQAQQGTPPGSSSSVDEDAVERIIEREVASWALAGQVRPDTGTIPDNAVTTAKIRDNAVTSRKIAAGAVQEAEIEDGAVTGRKLGALAVDQGNIRNNAVTDSKIRDLNVTSGKIADGAVTLAKLSNAARAAQTVSDGSITAAKLAANAVETAKVKDGAITLQKLAENARPAETSSGVTNIADDAVTSAKIASSAVRESHIQDGAVTSRKIKDNTIVAADLADQAVSQAKIANDAVRAKHINTSAVQSESIRDGAVTTAKIGSGQVTHPKLAANAVEADNVKSGAITEAKLHSDVTTKLNTRASSTPGAGAVGTTQLANNAVTAPKIASSAVTTSKIGNKQVTAAKIADGTITATQIAAGVIPSGGTGPTISGDISLSQLPDGTVIGLSRDANNNLLVRRVADAEENDYSDSTISLGPGIKYNWTINTPPLGTQEQQNARKLGDIYIVSNQNDMYVWAQDALGKRWERVSEPVIAAGSINASQLRASARTFIQAASPGGRAERGVFWVDTDADNKLWVRGQNDWIEVAAKAAAPETGLTGPRVARYTGEMTLRQVGTYVRTGAGWIMGPATFTPSIGSGIHDLEISLVRRAAGAQTTHLLSAFIDTSDLAAMTNNTSEQLISTSFSSRLATQIPAGNNQRLAFAAGGGNSNAWFGYHRIGNSTQCWLAISNRLIAQGTYTFEVAERTVARYG